MSSLFIQVSIYDRLSSFIHVQQVSILSPWTLIDQQSYTKYCSEHSLSLWVSLIHGINSFIFTIIIPIIESHKASAFFLQRAHSVFLRLWNPSSSGYHLCPSEAYISLLDFSPIPPGTTPANPSNFPDEFKNMRKESKKEGICVYI